MADYYRIETSNQNVTVNAAGEMFELIPATSNGLSNIVINAAGGNDTIKVSTSNVDATIMNLDPSSVLDLPGSSYYYSTQADGINIVNSNGNFKLKLLGTTDTSIFNNSNASFTSIDKKTTTANGQRLEGTDMADNLVVAHSNCTVYGYSGNDFVIAYGDNNSLHGDHYYSEYSGNDTIIATGNNNTLIGSYGTDVLIVGGNNNRAYGNENNDTFEIYSYTAEGSNNTLAGGSGYNKYIMSTGLVGVDGSAVGTAAYNPNFNDTVTVTITDAKSGDSYYMRDLGLGGINMSTTTDGVVISSTSGRITVTMKDQRDWNAVKTNLITLDNAQGNVGTYTLEQAVGLTGFNSLTTPPAGVFTNGDYLLVSSSFVGNLIMSSTGANYTNDQIITMDATQNYQAGIQIGGNSNANAIYAGQGGNILWGGEDTATDYLFGGAGTDVFQIGKYDGNDAVFGSGTNDVIHLYDVSVSDIVSYAYDTNTIALGLNSGNVVSVVNGDAISPTFILADGGAYRFNRAAYSWQGA